MVAVSENGNGNGRLTDKQALFIERYLQCFNATEACRGVYDSDDDNVLATIGSQNLSKPYIREMVNERLAELKVQNKQQVAVKPMKRKARIVYLICAANGLVKIGKTSDIVRRLNTLNTMSPIDLELLGVVASDCASEIEGALHTKFSDKRIKGEWFALTSSDIDLIWTQYEFR